MKILIVIKGIILAITVTITLTIAVFSPIVGSFVGGVYIIETYKLPQDDAFALIISIIIGWYIVMGIFLTWVQSR